VLGPAKNLEKFLQGKAGIRNHLGCAYYLRLLGLAKSANSAELKAVFVTWTRKRFAIARDLARRRSA
jgi:hypothetical protein